LKGKGNSPFKIAGTDHSATPPLRAARGPGNCWSRRKSRVLPPLAILIAKPPASAC